MKYGSVDLGYWLKHGFYTMTSFDGQAVVVFR